MRVEWRSASAMCGALCAIMAGVLLMQQLCVVSLDIPGKVRLIWQHYLLNFSIPNLSAHDSTISNRFFSIQQCSLWCWHWVGVPEFSGL